ncbi:branched-chain amino acid ABC transporter permease [Oxalobacteraceae bacterium OM1]|nr:branched-chain amino acid ABC transporter permease [Oxalobacteraceae bacterium OM1]
MTEYLLFSALYGVSYGLLLFMLSAGLTLIFGMLGMLNFAHGSFYMLGAYFGYAVTMRTNFWLALLVAPLAVSAVGALVERFGLRRLRHGDEHHALLLTYGVSYLLVQVVILIWGLKAKFYFFPRLLDGPMFSLYGTPFPKYRVFIMLVAVVMLILIYLLLSRTRLGIVIQASLTHPQMAEALGHDVPLARTIVFAGGAALAALAGVIGGTALGTSPSMGLSVGSAIFAVIVIGGLGSYLGALAASLLIGILQTTGIAIDLSLLDLLAALRLPVAELPGRAMLGLRVSEMAPMMPFLLMIAVLILRPKGLLGIRET